jgi:MGT family glycosyltransferase
MMQIGAHLVSRGHRVVLLTGSRFEASATAQGMEFRALAGRADFDDRDTDSYLPDRGDYRGLAQAQYDIQNIFVKTIPDQFRAVAAAVAAVSPAAIIVDAAFAGAAPLLFAPGPRPPIVAVGVLPLAQSSRDVAPYGMGMLPSSSALGRVRNRALNLLARTVLFRATQRAGVAAFAEANGVVLRHFVMDISSAYDRLLQLNTAEFEYPRSDIAPNTAFVGPLPARPGDTPLPEWWGDLDGGRRVVHVTQGTIDNHDLGRVIRPTVDGLAGEDVLVVVSTGGTDPAVLGEVPANVRVAAYLPYDRLLPLTSVFVTNGGFGGVQAALGRGVPIVIAGDTEDKPEVAARVGWTGAGVNLRTGTPTPDAVRAAVVAVLGDARYRARAGELRAAIERSTPLESIERVLAGL